MADSTPTANYGWPKPAPGASDDAWGGYLNTSLDGIDATIHGIQASVPAPYVLPNASTTVLGGVKVDGTTITASGGVISAAGGGGGVSEAPNDGSAYVRARGSWNSGGNFSDSITISAGSPLSLNIPEFAGVSGIQMSINPAWNRRWAITYNKATDPNDGSSTGSNFSITAFKDDTSPIDALAITRANGVCTFYAAIVNGPSDRSLKDNVEPIEGALDKVMALQGVSFNLITTPDKREIGLIAQDVAPVVPEIIQHYATHDSEGKALATPLLALDYPKLTALLIEAVKTLAARVEELEAARG